MSSSVSLLYVLIVWLLLIGQSEQACDAECITCTQDNTCSVCKVGFYVDGNYTLCSPCQQEGCTCTATQSCTGCIPGYYSDINQDNACSKCVYMDSGCTCSSRYGCDSCLPGYRRSSNDRCVPCQNGCTCSSYDNICTGCRDGYYLGEYNGDVYCFVCSDNCKLCSGGATSCTKCNDGYFLNNNTCDACDPTCSVCTSMDLCSACTDGFYLNSQTCCSNNCNRCGSSSCDTCAEGYGLEWRDNRNVCEQCPSNCLVCSHSTSCDTCMTGYYRYWSGSTYLCAQCQPECLDCINNGCYQCKEGSYLVDTCYNCSEGCTRCSSDTFCYTCQDGYYKSTNSGQTLCQPCMENCIRCDAANTCTECYPGYMFKENVCQQNCPVNCKNNMCSMDKKMCTAGCKDRYNGLICDENCSINCISCDQNSGRCTVCDNGFYGNVCSETCSSGCKTTNGTAVCNIVDGSCTDGCQLSTKYGPQCSKDCSVHCVNQECDRVTARCLKGCQPGYHGETCTFVCSEECVNGGCHGSNGSCISDCKEGFTAGQCTAGSSLPPEQSVDGGVIGGAVGGVVAGVLIIAGVVVVVYLLRRRRGTGRDEARNCGTAFDNFNGPSYENQTRADSTSRVVTEQQTNYVNLEIEPFRGGATCIDENAAAAENVYDELMEDRVTADVPYSTLSSAVEYEDVFGQPTTPSEHQDVRVLENKLQELTKQKDSAEKELLRRKLIAMIKKTEDELKTTHYELNQYPIDNE